ncbi:MAG: Holliday junction branch migration protein RuvA [Acidimicrobiales bacterium]
MIGWLSGRVVHQRADGTVVLDVNGVGYQVRVATPEMPSPGVVTELFVETVVRDDAITLYGFARTEERDLFTLLMATPGVGPSTALAALRTMTHDELTSAIDDGDVRRLSGVPGIGTKTASRIVLELRGKIAGTPDVATPPVTRLSDAVGEALRTLGYSTNEIHAALNGVTLPEDESEALRAALARVRHS